MRSLRQDSYYNRHRVLLTINRKLLVFWPNNLCETIDRYLPFPPTFSGKKKNAPIFSWFANKTQVANGVLIPGRACFILAHYLWNYLSTWFRRFVNMRSLQRDLLSSSGSWFLPFPIPFHCPSSSSHNFIHLQLLLECTVSYTVHLCVLTSN